MWPSVGDGSAGTGSETEDGTMGTSLTAVERAWLECCELAEEGPAFDAAYADFVKAVEAEKAARWEAEWREASERALKAMMARPR